MLSYHDFECHVNRDFLFYIWSGINDRAMDTSRFTCMRSFHNGVRSFDRKFLLKYGDEKT